MLPGESKMPKNGLGDEDHVPLWVRDAVFYQIFPDRFARSERVRKPSNLLPWGSTPNEQGFFGGDLLGVVEHLDYLTDLGITAIYLNPIFQSASNHRYHTHDYLRVDPLLGGDDAFRELVREAHAKGIRIILDGVFNHASRGFFQFNDILENGSHSPWVDWFYIEGWPLAPYDDERPANYGGWLGMRELPKFNTDNPEVREFLMGVGEYWVREFDIDGWRFDVPEEIRSQGFWEEFCGRVRAIKPDIYLVGEIWHEAHQWLGGERFDASMNYVFGAAAIAFAAGNRVSAELVSNRPFEPFPGINAAQFGERIRNLLGCYDWETTRQQFNLLGSHDTPRVLSIARGDKETLRLATLFQMTFPGTPSVYYGDEIALKGTDRYDEPHRDPDSRRAFPWHDESVWDREMLGFFREAIALRNAHSVLRGGHFRQLYADGQQYAFARNDEDEALLVVLNAADDGVRIGLPVGGLYSDGREVRTLLGDPGESEAVRDGQLNIRLRPRSGIVLS